MKQRMKTILVAAGVLSLSAATATAAVVTTDLNLRTGPGTQFGIVTAMPAGAEVDVDGCQANWCRVNWRGYSGFASQSYLAGEGYVSSAPVYAAPRRYSYYDYYDYYPRYRTYGFFPGFGLSLNFSDRDHRHGHHRRGRD